MESSILLFCSLAAISSGQGGGSSAAMAGSSLLQLPVPVGREELRSGQGCFRGWSCCWEAGGTWLVKKHRGKKAARFQPRHTIPYTSWAAVEWRASFFIAAFVSNTAVVVQPKLGNRLLLIPKSCVRVKLLGTRAWGWGYTLKQNTIGYSDYTTYLAPNPGFSFQICLTASERKWISHMMLCHCDII